MIEKAQAGIPLIKPGAYSRIPSSDKGGIPPTPKGVMLTDSKRKSNAQAQL